MSDQRHDTMPPSAMRVQPPPRQRKPLGIFAKIVLGVTVLGCLLSMALGTLFVAATWPPGMDHYEGALRAEGGYIEDADAANPPVTLSISQERFTLGTRCGNFTGGVSLSRYTLNFTDVKAPSQPCSDPAVAKQVAWYAEVLGRPAPQSGRCTVLFDGNPGWACFIRPRAATEG